MSRARSTRAGLWRRKTWIFSAIRGIMFGRLKPETYEVMFRLAAGTPSSITNPVEDALVRELSSHLVLARASKSGVPPYNEHTAWLLLPWEKRPRQIAMHRFLGALISFTDDYPAPAPLEFFPIERIVSYIEQIIAASGEARRPLTIPEQFAIALELAHWYPTAAAILAHFASRAIGRNHDQRIDSRLTFPPAAMEQWCASISHFTEDISPQFDPMGDTYHFWGHCAAGMILEAYRSRYPLQTTLYGAFYYNGPRLMHIARTYIARRPIHTDHRTVDRMALRVGHGLGAHFTGLEA